MPWWGWLLVSPFILCCGLALALMAYVIWHDLRARPPKPPPAPEHTGQLPANLRPTPARLAVIDSLPRTLPLAQRWQVLDGDRLP